MHVIWLSVPLASADEPTVKFSARSDDNKYFWTGIWTVALYTPFKRGSNLVADVHIEEDAVLMLPDARGIAGVELKVERGKLLSPDGSLENQR